MNPDLIRGLLDNKRGIVVALISLVLLGSGVFIWKTNATSQTKVEILDSGVVKGEETDRSQEVVINVSGAVKNPGVYRFKSGSRVVEAIEKAGGLSERADNDWIDRYINLSEVVKDGMKIYLPKKSETVKGSNTGAEVIQHESKISLNSASQTELESLPGVGPVTAVKIINARPYSRTEELSEKKVVNSKVYQQIKDLVAVW